MQFQLDESMELFRLGLEELSRERGFAMGAEGLVVKAVHCVDGKLKVEADDNGAVIYYDKKAHFFRGFMHLVKYLKNRSLNTPMSCQIEETVCFDKNGAMFDCSRNGVMKVETIQKYIRNLASLGMNTMMLYTEDTYEVEGEPYFGAFRGRYTYEELKECDDYADLFGIEVVPCIQALAHLHTVLRYSEYAKLRDTEDILLVGSEEVYSLLEKMIKSASSPFRSKRIHLGMDEAHGLGLGKYLEKNGYSNRFEIMNYHLQRVGKICGKFGLEPMIWSDMYFRLHSPTGDYYDLEENSDLSKTPKTPENMSLVYWNYYHDSKEHYHTYVKLHRQLASKIIFAGGSWIWNGIAPNISQMYATTNAALKACLEEDVREVICTFWQDNGAETPLEAGNMALVLYAEYGFHGEASMDSLEANVKDWVNFLWHDVYEGYRMLDRFDTMPGTLRNNSGADNPSKFLLYQDLLLGLFDEQIKGLHLGSYYKTLAEDIEKFTEQTSQSGDLFHYYQILAKLLSYKAELGIYITEAYGKKDMLTLDKICNETLYSYSTLLTKLKSYREKIWFQECKPFGYEVLDTRYGGLQARLESTKRRLGQYLSGSIETIQELEETRLVYNPDQRNPEHTLCSCNLWENIISAGNVSGV